jgi:hypothetical protein
VGVVAKEVQVCVTTSRTSGTSRPSTTTATLTSLGSSLEHVEGFLTTGSGGLGISLGLLLLMLLLLLLLFTLGALGDTLRRNRPLERR